MPRDLTRLVTPSTVLTRYVIGDQPELLALYADQRVMRYIEPGRPPEKVKATLQRMDEQWSAHGYGYWVVRRAPGGGPIVGAVMLMRDEARQDVELGYLVAPDAWGQGLATEACRPVVAAAFEVAKVPFLVARVEAVHGASQRVLAKLGFRHTHRTDDGKVVLDWFRLDGLP